MTTKSAREAADKGDLTKAAREMTLSSVGEDFSWSWTRGGEPSGNINVRTEQALWS